MKKSLSLMLLTVIGLFLFEGSLAAHCEIPCGIYDDEMRISMLNEHLATIEKSMLQIIELEKQEHPDANQLVRWIMNKEHHADAFQEIITQYFMTQRIKPDATDYDKKITLLHKMLIYSMKSKQTTDVANVEQLRVLIKIFKGLYFNEK